MNRRDLCSAVSASAGMSMKDATRAVESVFNNITAMLRTGNEVRLIGFGTFSVADRKATIGRNPRTGETVHIPARKHPKFKAGKALKAAVN